MRIQESLLREIFDCAVLMTPGHEGWVRNWVDSHQGQFGRVRLYVLDVAGLDAGAPADTQWLSRAQLALRRFDGCILPVAPESLSWVRTVLASAEARLRIPLIAVVFDITAPGILDLLSLGVADFVRAPVCADELRARLVHWHRQARPHAFTESATALSLMSSPAPVSEADRTPQPRNRRPSGSIQEPFRAYGGLPGSKHLSPRKKSPRPATENEVFDIGSIDQPFRQAKARMVEDFECAYLRHALSRHSGNVAQAARASSKHRRAFWALMRKHRIDAAHYRDNASLPEPPP